MARNAFSGVVLWKRDIEKWEDHLRPFRTGPTELQRRLVAVGDCVYVTLGYGAPVTALDAATGDNPDISRHGKRDGNPLRRRQAARGYWR